MADVIKPQAIQIPSKLSSYTDPSFGRTVLRVTDARADGLPWIGPEYSTVCPFNKGSSRFILVQASIFGVYDKDGAYLYDLPSEIHASAEPRWSKTNPMLLYYHRGNEIRSYSIEDSQATTEKVFGRFTIVNSLGEADMSQSNFLVLVGDGRFVFTYDIERDIESPILELPAQPNAVYLTPHNNVLVVWDKSGNDHWTGIELYDRNLAFVRQLTRAAGHMDVGLDRDGSEVIIWTNSADPNPLDCPNCLVKVKIEDGSQTGLLALDWALALHVSCPAGLPFAIVDTEHNPSMGFHGGGDWTEYANELIKLDMGGDVERLAHHNSRMVSYTAQPKVTVNDEGNRALFASNMDGAQDEDVNYVDTYMLMLDSQVEDVNLVTHGHKPPSRPSIRERLAEVSRRGRG